MNIPERLSLLPLIVLLVFFPALGVLALRLAIPRLRMQAFALINMLGASLLCVAATIQQVDHRVESLRLYLAVGAALVATYFGLILANYALLKAANKTGGVWGVIAFAAPIMFLIVIKYASIGGPEVAALLSRVGSVHAAEFFVGASYMAFRLSHLAREVHNDVVEMPTATEYVAFAFFVPTIWVGPISPYSTFHRSLESRSINRESLERSWLRILVGLTKYLFIATVANEFTYAGLLLDGRPHSVLDLAVAVPAYALYLYCNFSGFCDMAIGVSGLLGIEVAENFDRPFACRNLQEFWTRWHMTLSRWFRDMVFTPVLKSLVRIFGPNSMNQMVAVTIMLVFLLMGIWHGTGTHFALFGLSQGIGVATVHYYNLFLKRALGKRRYKDYQQNKLIRVAAVSLTASYFAISLFFFANSLADIRLIGHALSRG
jgi:D-alanyl-lipoteichoic acid acyltransferase DltB (MBOAT superfamily)